MIMVIRISELGKYAGERLSILTKALWRVPWQRQKEPGSPARPDPKVTFSICSVRCTRVLLLGMPP